MPVTAADVVRALIAVAPDTALARPWLMTLLPGLDAGELVIEPKAPPASHPFASEDDHQAAIQCLKVGATGRQIAEEFDIPLMAAAVWAQRTRSCQA